MGFILTQWGMEVFNVFHSFCICNDLALSLIFTSFFPCLLGFSLTFYLNFHVHLWSTAKAQLSIFAQVDNAGNAWVAGYTESSLDGHTNAGSDDIFLMKFDAQGVHLWTRQRGGESSDYAWALQVDGVRLRFRIFSMEEKDGKTLDPLARSMF